MRPDNKSESFTFHRNAPNTASDSRIQNCRRKLQDKFETSKKSPEDFSADRSVLSSLNLNETKRAFKSGAEKISKTFSSVRTTFGTISQKFKASTRRRQILEEGPMTPACATPQTFSRNLLERTPTKMYSPFSIDSPYGATTTPNVDKENQTPQGTKSFFQRKRNLLDDIF